MAGPKQEDRLRDFEAIFGTRDPTNEPTEASEEFFIQSGYRRDVTPNHIMAALRNTSYAIAAPELLESARNPGPEQEGALNLLMDIAVANMMIQKKQKEQGLRSAKGRRRTPEEAKAALEVRAIQQRLEEARKAEGKGKGGKGKGKGKGSRPSATVRPNLQNQPEGSAGQAAPDSGSSAGDAGARGRGRGQEDRSRHRSSDGAGDRDRSRSARGRGRHHTPASDRLGRQAPPQQRDGETAPPQQQDRNPTPPGKNDRYRNRQC